jgi:hypothetical protein
LPESIQFWKRKIEQIDPDLTFLMLRYLATFPESWYWQKWRDP